MDKKLSERIAEDGITIEASMAGMSEDMKRRTWNVTLRREGGVFRLPVEQRERPTAHDVLDLVCGVCNIIDQVDSRDEWAREYDMAGDPEHKTHTEKDFRTWTDINMRLLAFLGEDRHQAYLYNTDRSDG